MATIYAPTLVTTLGRVGTARKLRTAAKTDAGIVAAIRRHIGAAPGLLCGATVTAVEWSTVDGVRSVAV